MNLIWQRIESFLYELILMSVSTLKSFAEIKYWLWIALAVGERVFRKEKKTSRVFHDTPWAGMLY